MELYTHEYFMNEALKQAKIAFEEGEIPVGAVVVSNNKIIGRAYNQTERLNDVTAHAEMLAITAAANTLGAKYLNDCRIYITLEPCTMCAGALYWSQIAEVYYGASDPKRGFRQSNSSMLHPKTQVFSGILAAEAERLILEFFKKLRD